MTNLRDIIEVILEDPPESIADLVTQINDLLDENGAHQLEGRGRAHGVGDK